MEGEIVMKLRTGQYRYTSPRHFDEFQAGKISTQMCDFMVCVVPFVELLEMRNKNKTTKIIRGFPRYLGIEPTKKELWFFPTPNKSYVFSARVSEIFEI
jgi:hypothetical protein